MNQLQQGLVISSYGQHSLVQATDGSRHSCTARRRKQRPVCGDTVLWHGEPGKDAVIDRIEERRNQLQRFDVRSRKIKIVAANLDLLLLVIAPEPSPEAGMIDRYLVAAALADVPVLLALNKSDLPARVPAELLEQYQSVSLDIHTISTTTGAGLPALAEKLQGQRALLVGQSGVGKSSLLKALVPNEQEIRTSALSVASGEGVHTTTVSTLYAMPEGGELIDSPGVRDFKLWPMSITELEPGYPDIHAAAAHCRFNDCRHQQEPRCAVTQAVEQQDIHPARYRRFVNLQAALSKTTDHA